MVATGCESGGRKKEMRTKLQIVHASGSHPCMAGPGPRPASNSETMGSATTTHASPSLAPHAPKALRQRAGDESETVQGT